MQKETNNQLNFPRVYEKDDHVALFHCEKCGYHPDVIRLAYRVDNGDLLYFSILQVLPQKTHKKEDVFVNKTVTDCEIVAIHICAICGSQGYLVEVPKLHLKMNGFMSDAPKRAPENPSSFLKDIKEKLMTIFKRFILGNGNG